MNSFTQRSVHERSGRERAGALALLFALLVCSLLAIGSFANRAEAAGSCVIPSDSIGVKTTDTTHPDAAQPWDNARVEVSLTNLDGVAAGCTATVQLPDVFTGMVAKTTYLNADGTSSNVQRPDTIAVMSTNRSGQMLFTTTDYPSTHEGVSATGWANAQITDAIADGGTQPLNFTVNGTTRQEQLPVGPCVQDCAALPTKPSKWGVVNEDGSGTVTVQTPVADHSGTAMSIADQLTSPGQTLVGVDWVSGYDCMTARNSPGALADDGSCAAGQTVPVNYTQNGQQIDLTTTVDHEFVRAGLKMTFTGDGPWTDTATVTVDGVPSTASTTVKSYDLGGAGTGHDKSTSTPSSPSTPVTPTSPSTPTTPSTPVTPTSPSTPTTPSTPVTPTSPTSPVTPTSPSTSTTPTSPSTSTTPTSPCTSMTTPSTSTPSTSTPASPSSCGGVPSRGTGVTGHPGSTPGMGPKVQTDKLGGGQTLQFELALAGIAASGAGLVGMRMRRSRR